MMKYHMAAFAAGFILDCLFGDPYWLPHPIRAIGNLIAGTEKRLRKGEDPQDEKKQRTMGKCLAAIVLLVTFLVSAAVLLAGYAIHPWGGVFVEAVMTYQILAAKCLASESKKVWRFISEKDVEGARHAVSMIVGRDTDCLNAEQIAKAAIETVAENTSDGVIAPMLYTALGGPVLGFLYKAVNTMDSMVGYKNDRYLHFGRAAAKLDDAVNYIPSRISAYLMVLAAFVCGKDLSGKGAWKIYRRDNRNHASPNSAQTESACAGALGVCLAGDAVYFGKVVKKPTIGDALRPVEYEDIRRANRLMYGTAVLCEFISLAAMALAAWM